jgi:hypothetical protein
MVNHGNNGQYMMGNDMWDTFGEFWRNIGYIGMITQSACQEMAMFTV